MKREQKKAEHHGGWMKLDNAAKIYPPVTRGELTNVFRLTVFLNTPVRITVLQQAVKETADLFPLFSVDLCSGIFWYFLEFNGMPPRIHVDEGTPCRAFPRKKGEVMYRILVREDHISVEFLHIITDGGGAMLFLKTLLERYNTLCGDNGPLFTGEVPDVPVTKSDDVFRKHSRKRLPKPERLRPAWHLPFNCGKKPGFRTISLMIPADRLAETAKNSNATVTEYFTSVYLFALQRLRKKQGRGSSVLRLQIPVDLRKRYNEVTTRNFSAFVMPEIDLRMGTYSFDEILAEVKYALGIMAGRKRLTRIISRNVASENNPVIRVMPLLIKNIALRIAHRRLGISQFSGVFTNLGKIETTDAGESLVRAISVMPPPPHPDIKVSCGMATTGNNTIVTFGSVTTDTSLEKEMVRFFTGRGIPVEIFQISK